VSDQISSDELRAFVDWLSLAYHEIGSGLRQDGIGRYLS